MELKSIASTALYGSTTAVLTWGAGIIPNSNFDIFFPYYKMYECDKHYAHLKCSKEPHDHV